MRNTANIAQVMARLSEYLRQVKRGGEVVITERGIPVARLVPLDGDEGRATREERLIGAGVLRLPPVLARSWRTQHPLRAADALQLAAALIWCDEQPAAETFVCLDRRLRDAARREGVTLVPSD